MSVWTLPNVLSLFRVVSAPVLLGLAWFGWPVFWLVLFGLTLLSDALDGFFARRRHEESAVGARLDSWGDFAMVAVVPVSALLLWPRIIVEEAVFIALALIGYFVPTIFGAIKYGRPTSYHTWGAKLSAILFGASLLLMFLGGPHWPFRVSVAIGLVEGVEELCMTAVLRDWHANVPSLWHALKLRRSKRQAQVR